MSHDTMGLRYQQKITSHSSMLYFLPLFNITFETRSTMAKIEKPHNVLEASNSSNYYRQSEEGSGTLATILR